MKNVFWVFQSFGFRAGIRYVWDAFWLKMRRLFRLSPKPMKFEDLTDEQAEKVAWAFGLYQWEDREDLNKKWVHFENQTLH